MPDGSYTVPDIQNCIKYIIRKHKKFRKILSIHVINRVDNRVVFKIKDVCKVELQTLATMKLVVSIKKNNRQNIKWRKCTMS